MTVFVQKPKGKVLLRIRAEGDGPAPAPLVHEVKPGETALGRTYEEWAEGPEVVEVADTQPMTTVTAG